MNIDILIPVALPEAWRRVAVARYAKYALPDTTFRGRDLSGAKISVIDYHSAPKAIVEIARQAEAGGADACIIDCFTDPGLEECSTALKIPVVGVGQAGMLFAHAVAQRFAIITSQDDVIRIIEKNASRYGTATHVHSIASIDMPFNEIPHHAQVALDRLEQIGKSLLNEITTFVMGCTELAEMSDALCQRLRRLNPKVRVINPLEAATHLAETQFLLHHDPDKLPLHNPSTELGSQ